MEVCLIDLEELFDDRYKKINRFGTGAVSVITTKQMVSRFNDSDVDKESGQVIKGLGNHRDAINLILKDVFEGAEISKIFGENIYIRYINDEYGNQIFIELPNHKTITSNQLMALERLNEEIERVNPKLSMPIEILAGSVFEAGSMRSKILPFLKTIVDDNFSATIEDVNIISDGEVSNIVVKRKF